MAVALNRQAISLRQANSDDMAKVTFIDPIKSVSGKLTKKHCVVYNVRQAVTNNEDMIRNPNYTAYRDPSKKIKLTANQKNWQERFGQLCAATQLRLQSPDHINQDRAAFAKQTKYKTLYSYVFNIVKNEEV